MTASSCSFLDPDWCDASWTPWAPFDRLDPRFAVLPPGPGVYRIRPAGQDRLAYVGQTGTVRHRVAELRRQALAPAMPFNDPHTAGPSLWAWRDAEGLEFECSGAPLPLDDRTRQAFECYLLWRYRLEYSGSTLCNHGRFHPCYHKSGSRKSGLRGGRLPDGEINPAGGASLPPLQPHGAPPDADWMGMTWTDARPLTTAMVAAISPTPGLYKLLGPDSKLLYVGESSDLRARLIQHARVRWEYPPLHFSFSRLPVGTPAYQRHELENDLIGGFYALTNAAPTFQFANVHSSRITFNSPS
jgi:hypothetical protein